jgi:hypothetical protein
MHPEGRIENDFGGLIFSLAGFGIRLHGGEHCPVTLPGQEFLPAKHVQGPKHSCEDSPWRPWRPLRPWREFFRAFQAIAAKLDLFTACFEIQGL